MENWDLTQCWIFSSLSVIQVQQEAKTVSNNAFLEKQYLRSCCSWHGEVQQLVTTTNEAEIHAMKTNPSPQLSSYTTAAG